MAPTLPPDVVSYLGPATNEEDQYTYPGQPIDGSEDISGKDRDYNNAYGNVEDDEGYESSPDALKDDRHIIDKPSASSPEILDATKGTLFRRLEWERVGSKTDYRNSMDTMYGSDFSPRPPPWPTDKTIFAFGQKDKDGKDLAETATFAKCINDFPNTLSTCEINGVPGVDYWEMLVERIGDLATSHDRPASELAFEKLTDITEEIAEAPCNIQKLCRRVLHRQTNYHRRPEGGTDPRFDIGWKSLAEDGTLPDLRISTKARDGAKKAGKELAKSLQSLEPLDCTIGNNTAPVFVELTRAQLRDIDGDWYNSGPTLQSFNTSINQAKTADCPAWKQKKTFTKEGTKAVERAYSTKMEAQQQSRYFHKSATDQLEYRQESMAAPSKFAGSLAGTAALAAVVANYMF